MKLKLKTGEHIRIETDATVPMMIYVVHGIVHVTAQPLGQPTRIIVEGDVKIEQAKA